MLLYMLQECSILRVANVFFREPTKMHYLTAISKSVDLAHTSVKQHLEDLEKQGIIRKTVEKRGKRLFPSYTANIQQQEYRHYKQAHNLHSIQKLTRYLADTLMPRCIILFGSYQRGEDDEESDVDLFIECKKKPVNLQQYEKEIRRKIQIHFNEDFTTYPSELKNNIINGIVLHGYLEGYK